MERPEHLMGDPERIALVVEDDPMVAMGLSFLLEDLGFTPYTAASGREAIDALRASDTAVALVDFNLGGTMNGVETIAALRKSSHIPCILTTGALSTEIESRAVAAGAFAVLQKPFTAEALKAALHEALMSMT